MLLKWLIFIILLNLTEMNEVGENGIKLSGGQKLKIIYC